MSGTLTKPGRTLASVARKGKPFAKNRSVPPSIAAIAVLLLLASLPQSHAAPTQGSRSTGGLSLAPSATSARPASMGLSAAPSAVEAQGAPSPIYDEQLGTTFTQDFSSLAYNITAAAQADADGYGPGYLLNGLTTAGYWYQVGVSYHWPNSDGSYDPGFGFSYEVYSSDGKSVYPSKGAGLGSFSGVVTSGDSVLLSLTFTGSTVQMQAQDWNTGATADAIYSSEGASSFVGDSFSPVDSHGFFTGLMTEWYHSAAYFGNEGKVAYTNTAVALSSAWMWIDEFDTSTTAPSLFDNQTQAPVIFLGDQVYPFAAGGATMYISAHSFVTGLSGAPSRLTLTPANTGAPAPAFSASYTLAGQPQTAILIPGVNGLEADPGTMIRLAIAQSSTSEYWVFNGTSGNEVTFAAGTDATYVYYHVVEETVSYQVAGGGQPLPGPSEPLLSYQEPPPFASAAPAAVTATQVLSTTPAVIFVLAGSVVGIGGTISGGAAERWATNMQNQTILVPNSLPDPIQFYQQYDVSVSYSILGGGVPPEVPEFNSTAFGVPAVILLSNNSTTGWFDAGSDYSFTNVLNGTTSTERWDILGDPGPYPCHQPVATCVDTPGQEISAAYTHQYNVDLAVNDASGGGISGNYSRTYPGVHARVIMSSVPLGPTWMDAGGNLSLTARATDRWQFETWVGSGVGAYGGANPSIEVTVTGPLTENATFYPQLAISAGGGTNIAYSYGSSTGTVQAGTTKTLYVPPSTNVTLRAAPSLFVYSFASWHGTGLAKSTKPSLSLVIDSPSAVTGASSYNYPALVGASVVAAIVVIVAVSLMIRSRRRRAEIYGFSPPYP
jgi:hypothetical protein